MYTSTSKYDGFFPPEFKKNFLQVDVTFLPNGRIIPKSILGTSGRPIMIDNIVKEGRGWSQKRGGGGIVYTVLIGDRLAKLYFDEGKFFGEWVDERD